MNKLRYMILAMTAMLSFAAISCNQDEEYAPGKPDSEDCFGVYFPSQDATSRTFTFEPGDRRRVKTEAVMDVLQENGRTLRGELGNKVGKQLRIVPEIVFYLDSSLDYVEHIEELLKK